MGDIKPLPSIRIERGRDMAGKAEYKNKWISEKCDRVNLILPKGRKAELQAHASERNESLNGFVNRAIDCQMERDKAKDGEAN